MFEFKLIADEIERFVRIGTLVKSLKYNKLKILIFRVGMTSDSTNWKGSISETETSDDGEPRLQV